MNDALHLDDRVNEPGKRAAAIMAVAVHVLLALFLIYGIRWQSTMPAAVEVELVSSVPAAAPKSEPKPEPKPEVKPEPKVEPKVETPPPKPIVAPKPDIAIKEKPEKKPEPKPLFDPIKDMLKRETEQNNKDKLRDMLAKEEAATNASTAANANTSSKSKARYVDRISAKIRGNLVVPPGVSGNPEAEFRVNQLPTGEVIEVKLRKSSGNRALDEAIERAIHKSSPLPKPERNEDFDRALDLKFKPLEQVAPN